MRKTAGIPKACGLWLLLLAASVPASAQPPWKGTIVREGGVTVVKNPKEPIYKTPVLELEEELSLGGPDAQGEYVFGQIRHFAVDDAGAIYVLDSQALNVKVFDASGSYVRTIGRKGQGPGEFEAPRAVSINRASGELAVLQIIRRISFFKLDGTFLRHLPLKEIWALDAGVDSRGRIYVSEGIIDEKEPHFEQKMLGPDGAVIATLARSPAAVRADGRLTAFAAIASFIVDREDHFIYGYPATYEIQYFGPAAPRLLKRITREYDPVAVTEEERREREKQGERSPDQVIEFPKCHPAYDRFFASDDGHLIVRTWEKAADGRFVHDVFDAQGRFIGRIPLKPSGLEMLKGKYYALEEDEDGYQYVKRYAVTWKDE